MNNTWRIIILIALLAFAPRTHAGNIIWTNATGGDWDVANNWLPHLVPTDLDTAIITNNGIYTINVNISADLGGLILGNDNMGTQTLLVINQNFNLSGLATVAAHGQITLLGTTWSGGSLTISSNAVLTFLGDFNEFHASESYLNDLQFTNYGTVNWTNVTLDSQSGGNSTIYNYGLWDAQTDAWAFSFAFFNYGTFRKSGGVIGNDTFFSASFFNEGGTVDIQAGTLALDPGQSCGTFNMASNTLCFFLDGGGFNFYSNNIFSGQCVLTGDLNFNNATLIGSLSSCYDSTFTGNLTLSSNATLNIINNFRGYSGTSDDFNHLFPNYATVDFNDLQFTNCGTVNWTNVTLTSQSGGNSTIYNYGLWDAQTDAWAFSFAFFNYGTFQKSGGVIGKNTVFYGPFSNEVGAVDIQKGVLGFLGTCSLTGGKLNFGVNSLIDYGKIFFVGNANLEGGISVKLNNNYVPNVGDAFELVSYGSQSGGFTGLDFPAGIGWLTNYGSSAFTLSVTALLPNVLTVTNSPDNSIQLNWSAIPGQIFQLQYTTNLTSDNWIDLGGGITATNTTVTLPLNINSDPQQFYRTLLLQ